MANNEQNEIELSKVFRALFYKWWVILLSVVVGALIGVGFAYVQYNGKDYYGTTVQYDVSVHTVVDGQSQSGTNYTYTDKHMARMISVLNSDSFTEKLMTHIEGAPKKEEDSEAFYRYNRQLQGCLSYKFDEDNLNALFVSVKVLNNKAFADALLEAVKAEVPVVVSEKMIVPSSNDTVQYETVVEELSLSRCELLNVGQVGSQMFKYGLVLGVAALLIACIAIVVADSTDKRLRNPSAFSTRTGLTILATIPSLPENIGNKEADK